MGNDALGDLVHDINGTCAHLKNAASMLRGEDSPEELELLGLMSQKARKLSDAIEAYAASRRGRHPR